MRPSTSNSAIKLQASKRENSGTSLHSARIPSTSNSAIELQASKRENLHTARIPSTPFCIKNRWNHLVLECNKKILFNSPVELKEKTGEKNQQWLLTPDGFFISQLNPFVLTINPNQWGKKFNQLVTFPNEGKLNQKWRADSEGFIYSEFHRCAQWVLDVQHFFIEGLSVNGKNGGLSQQWDFVEI